MESVKWSVCLSHDETILCAHTLICDHYTIIHTNPDLKLSIHHVHYLYAQVKIGSLNLIVSQKYGIWMTSCQVMLVNSTWLANFFPCTLITLCFLHKGGFASILTTFRGTNTFLVLVKLTWYEGHYENCSYKRRFLKTFPQLIFSYFAIVVADLQKEQIFMKSVIRKGREGMPVESADLYVVL